MNNGATRLAGLATKAGGSVSLREVQLTGVLEGLMLTNTVRQTYINSTEQDIETVYTFPLPHGATLMGLRVELNGQRLEGAVFEKKKASRRYERAIEEGDTPVMVERTGAGVFAANLGNLRSGEKAVIEIEYVQLLRFEMGQIRIRIPTVIAPRFGEAHGDAGMQVHQTDAVNPLVEYGLSVQLDMIGTLAQASIKSPTHAIGVKPLVNGKRVTLSAGGYLDRDFVVNLSGLEGKSFALMSKDGDGYAMLASFCPTIPAQVPRPVSLKVLVDCSGSMAGDSITQAKSALAAIAKSLTPADKVSYTRFGSTVQHLDGTMCDVSAEWIASKLLPAIDRTQADLGGTNLEAALQSTFQISTNSTELSGSDVLLITDGALWDVDKIIGNAVTSGHRIFAVGVGSAPAESLLRELAEKTGGACELVTPNEAIAEAIDRMFKRMRGGKNLELDLQWGASVSWQSKTPRQIYDGETIHVFVQLEAVPSQRPTLSWHGFDREGTIGPHEICDDTDGKIARLCAMQRIMETANTKEITSTALKYQLVTRTTNLILIHVRASGDKASGMPALEQIEQMMAAGHAGFGTVADVDNFDCLMLDVKHCATTFDRQNEASYAPKKEAGPQNSLLVFNSATPNSLETINAPLFNTCVKRADPAQPLDGRGILMAFNDLALKSNMFEFIVKTLNQMPLNAQSKLLLESLTTENIDLTAAWAIYLSWLAASLNDQVQLNANAIKLLDKRNASLTVHERLEAQKIHKSVKATTVSGQ